MHMIASPFQFLNLEANLFGNPIKHLLGRLAQIATQDPFPIVRRPYQMILRIINRMAGPSKSHRMPPRRMEWTYDKQLLLTGGKLNFSSPAKGRGIQVQKIS